MTETSDPVLALRVRADVDLSALTDTLWREQTPHRVVTQGDEQLLYVLDEQTAARVQAVAAALAREPQRSVGTDPPDAWLPSAATVLALAKRAPVTSAFIVLALLCAPISLRAEPVAWMNALFIVSPSGFAPPGSWTVALAQLQQTLAGGAVWRLLTPCLLHASLLHLAMNVLLFWEFGRRIESVLAIAATLGAVVFIGVLSNLAQFVIGGTANFGGLSGIVAGQLGMILLLGRRSSADALRLPRAMSMGMLVSLAVMSTGVTEYFGLYIANTAHWVGLAAGVAVGALWPLPPASEAQVR